MKKIKLTQGKMTLVDDENFEELSRHKWCAVKGGDTFYAARRRKREDDGICNNLYMHRVIMNSPLGVKTDHKDRNGLNDQKLNLRFCTHSQNKMNGKIYRNSISGIKGVSWKEKIKKWQVRISMNGETKHLGVFSNKSLAMKIYDKAAKELFKDFACLNSSFR